MLKGPPSHSLSIPVFHTPTEFTINTKWNHKKSIPPRKMRTSCPWPHFLPSFPLHCRAWVSSLLKIAIILQQSTRRASKLLICVMHNRIHHKKGIRVCVCITLFECEPKKVKFPIHWTTYHKVRSTLPTTCACISIRIYERKLGIHIYFWCRVKYFSFFASLFFYIILYFGVTWWIITVM